MLPHADAVLFDLDGVIVDSRLAFARCMNAALAEHGLPERPEEELHPYLGPPVHETFRRLAGDGADDGALVQSCVDAYRARYRSTAVAETSVVAGMPEALAALGATRTLAVVTSKPKPLAEPLLRALGLHDRFAAVFGPSLEVEAEEKATTMARALDALPALERPVMVGDRHYDVIAATAHGIPCIGVLWGIGSEAELRDAGAAALASTPAEVVELLGDGAAPAPRG
jgi:phosphoglycolate phosphatase